MKWLNWFYFKSFVCFVFVGGVGIFYYSIEIIVFGVNWFYLKEVLICFSVWLWVFGIYRVMNIIVFIYLVVNI